MEIVGYILIGVGAIGLLGNLAGGGGLGDPNPTSVNARLGCFGFLIAAGGLLWWLSN